mgnify:CR=1 FL=1
MAFRAVWQAGSAFVETDTTYMEAVGRWTVPDPIAPDSVMGIELQCGGEARSLRMATLSYVGADLAGCLVCLRMEHIIGLSMLKIL